MSDPTTTRSNITPFRQESEAVRLAAARAEQQARAARVDAFTVTRSHIRTGKALVISPEFEVGEERARAWRGKTNRAEQIVAWRRLLKPGAWWRW